MIKPIYLDLHIHTSDNADSINQNYKVKDLVKKIKEYNKNSECLLSLTDHNTINKKAYQELIDMPEVNILLGVELHIRNYQEVKPYHAHIYFNLENIIDSIDSINLILNELYPTKMVSDSSNIPTLEKIIQKFDDYDFMLLPHGGQNHNTFNKSIPEGKNFDSTLERTIYYNQFDGFTARSNNRIEETIAYFKKLNINDFINLITGTDNYDPIKYPNPKSGEQASDFVPTWMLAEPTFEGLRLSLSESSRLIYSIDKPEVSEQIIKSCNLINDNTDIDVDFSPGLNVIIGESSSGKSLLIDSLYRKIVNDFEGTNYSDFKVEQLSVDNPQNFRPHYINQNFIVDKINKKKISDIEIIKSLFPSNVEIKMEVESKLQQLQTIISNLISSVENIETLRSEIRSIPILSKLIFEGSIQTNPINLFIPDNDTKDKIKINKVDFDKYINTLEEIKKLSVDKVFVENVSDEIDKIAEVLKLAYSKSQLSDKVQLDIKLLKDVYDREIVEKNGERARKKTQIENLLIKVQSYYKQFDCFKTNLEKLLAFDYKIETQKVNCGGHELSIINEFKITPEVIVTIINKYIKSKARIETLEALKPDVLFKNNFSEKPLVSSYDDLNTKIYNDFSKSNEEKYSIITKDNKNFDKLSPGWKTAVLLDLIFSSTNDYAPLLIDQPEDNLASTYLNGGMINSIHNAKKQRQIIVVSHNATIPMLGDAQNVIVCRNVDGTIIIRNAPLESKIENVLIVDSVAKLTDGGKTAIKKRFKKYNLKKYRGEENETNN